MRDLQTSLRDHSMGMLRAIAELNRIELASNVRDEAADQLAAALAEPETAGASLAACSPTAQQAWQALAQAGGHETVPSFSRQFGGLRAIGPGKLECVASWREPTSPCEELWYHGLIYRGFADLGSGPAEYFYVPDDLQPTGAQAVVAGAESTPPAPDRGSGRALAGPQFAAYGCLRAVGSLTHHALAARQSRRLAPGRPGPTQPRGRYSMTRCAWPWC